MIPRVLVQSFFTLSMGHVGAKAIGFGASVLLARFLNPDTLGVFASLAVLLGFGFAACNWGTDALGIKAVARDPNDVAGIARSIMRYRFVTVSIAGVCGAVICVATGASMALLTPVLLSLMAFALRRDWALLGRGDVRSVSLALLVREIVFLTLVILLLRGHPVLRSALWCLAAAEAAWTLATHLLARGHRSPGRGPSARLWFREGWPIAIVSVMTLANNKVDVPILALLRDAGEAGMYWAAYNVLFAAMAFAALLTRVVLPEMSRHTQIGQEHGARSTFSLAVACGVIGGVLAVVLSLGAAPLMGLLYPEKTQGGVSALRLLAFSLPAHYLSAVLIGRLVAEGRQRAWTVAALSGGVVNVVLNLLLIPSRGMQGAAIATIASECVLLGVVISSFKRHALFRSLVYSSSTLMISLIGGVVLMSIVAVYGSAPAAMAAIAPLIGGTLLIFRKQGVLRVLTQR